METAVSHNRTSTREWLWVFAIGIIWLIISFLPTIIVVQNLDNDWEFMGIANNPKDGGSYLSKIDYGMDGHWGYSLQHTPTDHDEAYIFFFYVALGQLANLFGLNAIIIFQIARIFASLFMLSSIYWLGAQFWQEIKLRRRFVLIATFATGFGWLGAILLPNAESLPPDLVMPESFPYYAVFANPHFPLSIACMALVSGFFIRYANDDLASIQIDWSVGILFIFISVFLATTQPPALGVMLAILGLVGLWQTIETQQIPQQTGLLFILLLGPAIPIWLYFLNVFSSYEIWTEFNDQNVTPSPHPFFVLLSFSVFFAISLPLWPHIQIKNINLPTKFMLVWVVFVFVAIYIPYALQRRFLIGITLPLTYFAVQATQSYWDLKLSPTRQRQLAGILIILVLPSYLFGLAPSVFVASDPANAMLISGLVLPEDYSEALHWLDGNTEENDVILAAPPVGLWIPSRTPARVFYGHEYETVPEVKRLQQAEDFYAGENCELLIENRDEFEIDYVLWGPAEDIFREDILDKTDQPSISGCLKLIQESVPDTHIEQFGKVSIFVLDDTIRASLVKTIQDN